MTETVELGASRRKNPLRFVLVVDRDAGPERVPLDGTLLIGKHPDNDVVIHAPGVSRYHLELRAETDRVLVKDVGSKNGTFFDGARITELRLGPGASFRIGGPGGLVLSLEILDRPQLAPSAQEQFGPLIGQAPAMRQVFTLLERTAPSDVTLLVTGETGTGKELVARAVHDASPRKAGPYVVVDCAAIPEHLIESELFGHIAGAFTDARDSRKGAFESADGGTLFLDEVGELPLELQPKLLRAVESRTIQRLGESTRRPVSVRLVSATHRDLNAEVQAGRFRQDLFFRLAVVNVHLPPLRERGQDILRLAEHLLQSLGAADAVHFDGAFAEALMQYHWPGNVRELRNAVERAMHLGAQHALPMFDDEPDAAAPAADAPDLPFKEAKAQIVSGFERAYVQRLMQRHNSNISAAARDAGIDRNYLYRLLEKHGLS